MKKTDNLYTWVLAFRGGSYVDQVWAASVEESVFAWLKEQAEHPGEIAFLGTKTLREIERAFREDEAGRPVPLNGMQHAWYVCVLSHMGALHIHIIQTEV